MSQKLKVLDDMRMYNRALTENEAESFYKLYLRKASQKKRLAFFIFYLCQNK
jgi:hypothetical protein